jgi:O-6-methylguanine DNA methyltransferase
MQDRASLAPVIAQLAEYFAVERRSFDVALDLVGTEFQLAVWHGLLRIPYGTTVSYSELAQAIGRPDVVRAVGAAVGQTPVPIVVPCHRVIGKNGSLTGYGGGLHRKAALLELERRGDERQPGAASGLRQLALI